MEEELDKKLYNEYLKGKKEAFELLYKKYKARIEYFIYNIVKDYQKAEDIAQETFFSISQEKFDMKYSFKYHIYLIAKSKAINYINVEKRRNEITEEYYQIKSEDTEPDILETITQEETKKEIIEAINLLDEKYRNAIYLVNIEGLSYKETSEVLGKTLQNTKNLIHRGKKELKTILLKKGFKETNRRIKVLILIFCISVIFSGIVYSTILVYNEYIKKQEDIETRGLFDLGDGITTYEIDLRENDMIFNQKSKIYHKIITDKDEYIKYKSRVNELPEVSEIQFEKNFIIILANESKRCVHEKDLMIYDITADDNCTHIKMKQKDNPNYENDSNVWYAVVDKSLLRENADVIIEHMNLVVEGFVNVTELPKDYSLKSAINDGCIVLEDNKVKSNNIELLDKFIEKTSNGENSSVRIYSKNGEKIYIKDIVYLNGIYYFNDYNLMEEEKSYLYSYTGKFTKSNSVWGTAYSWKEENGDISLVVIRD